jgi:tetratricopeptide (TPR) repeat protein
MIKKNEYEIARDLYFGIDCTAQKKEAQTQLEEIYAKNEDAVLRAKAAYFLGAIYLTEFELVKALTGPINIKSLTKVQLDIIKAGMEWLKKSHDLGHEEASLLLGRIYATSKQPATLSKIQLSIDGNVLGEITYHGDQFDCVLAINFLTPLAAKNPVAAKILARFGQEYLDSIRDLIRHSFDGGSLTTGDVTVLKSKLGYESFDNFQIGDLINHPTRALDDEFKKEYLYMFNKPVELECSKFLQALKTQAKEKRPFDVEKTLQQLMVFLEQGSIQAQMIVRKIWKYSPDNWNSKTDDLIVSRLAGHSNPQRAAVVDALIWQQHLTAVLKAIGWLENANKLECKGILSPGQIETFRQLLKYIEQRAKGASHQVAYTARQVAEFSATQSHPSSATLFAKKTNFEPIYKLGVAQHKNGEFDNSLRSLKRAAELVEPTTINAGNCYSALATAFRDTNDYADALVACEKAVTVFVNFNNRPELASKVLEKYRQCLNLQRPMAESLKKRAKNFLKTHRQGLAKVLLEYMRDNTKDPKVLEFVNGSIRECGKTSAPTTPMKRP